MKRLEPNTKPLFESSPKRAAIPLVLGASLSLSACSYVPDWGNPIVWYDSIFSGGLFGGDGDAPPKAEAREVEKAGSQAESGESKGFPNLGSVPTEAPRTSSSVERQRTSQELVADRDNARYTDQVLRAGGTPKTPEPVRQVASAQPVATARLPKLDPQPAVVPPPPSAVPRAQAASPMPRPIVEPERGPQAGAPYPPPAGEAAGGMTTAAAPPSAAPEQSAPQPAPPAAAPVSTGPGQGVLAQTFAEALAQSADTVSTAPPGTSFGAPSAAPLTPDQTSVPDIVREAYNESLVAGSGIAPSAANAPDAPRLPGLPSASAPSGPATVYFGHGSARLSGKAKAVIRDVAEAYKTRPGTLRVVGHASHRTRDLPLQQHKLVNFRVSLDRATAVANELIRLGVDGNAVQIVAVSDSQSVFHEWMPKGEAGNRRAEIFHSF